VSGLRIPKYRKHSIKDLGFVEWKGRRHYFPGRYNSAGSREAYRQFLFRNVGAPPADPEPASSGFSVTKLVIAYLNHAEAFYGSGSRGEYANCRHALKPLGKRFAGIPAEKFGPKMLKQWQVELAAKKQARPYINAQCSKIKRAFRWAASEELIPVTVYQGLCTVPGLRANRSEAAEPAGRKPVPWGDVEPVLLELNSVVADMVGSNGLPACGHNRFAWRRSSSSRLAKIFGFGGRGTRRKHAGSSRFPLGPSARRF
jgi:hypothetical protein